MSSTPPDLLPAWLNHADPADVCALMLLDTTEFKSRYADFPASWQVQIDLMGFGGRAGQILVLPASNERATSALVGISQTEIWFGLGRALAAKLPPGSYAVPTSLTIDQSRLLYVGFGVGSYGFDRFRSARQDHGQPSLCTSGIEGLQDITAMVEASNLVRNLVNMPASHMGPAELEAEVRAVAEKYGAHVGCILGEDLLEQGYPAVHAVGRAATPHRAPRMIEMTWGSPDHPGLCLIGKGVTFDTGGLDLKPSAGMRWMKKDMGGAAHALGLAQLVMQANLPVRLCLLIPAVENAVSGDAMRPGDVLDSRSGMTIEVGNTDAEGRLILADALTRAGELDPVLTIDLATLTGAARVAVGPDLVPFFSTSEAIAQQLRISSPREEDPMWELPLWPGYQSALKSDIADLKNDPSAWAQAGCITAALFLKEFAPKSDWVHLDVFAWNNNSRPGWPTGAEAQGLRALFEMIRKTFLPV